MVLPANGSSVGPLPNRPGIDPYAVAAPSIYGAAGFAFALPPPDYDGPPPPDYDGLLPPNYDGFTSTYTGDVADGAPAELDNDSTYNEPCE